MSEEMKHDINAPVRTHKPVWSVDYKEFDLKSGYGDAHYLDIGQSTWNREDFSAKIWRWAEEGKRWSRQGEELPLSRVLDLATLVIAVATGRSSVLQEFVQNESQKDALSSFLLENMQILGPKLDELRRVLQPSIPSQSENCEPNLFSFATSELSQDAMFSWLLSWANPECGKSDSSLYSVAASFIALLIGRNDLQVKKIHVGRQLAHIDVWAEINDNTILIIEDKTGTTIHDDQLKRYRETVEKKYPGWTKCYAYVKTGNEPKSILREVESAGYRIILRKDIIECLDKYVGANVLLCNYREHLRAMERDTQSYKTLPLEKWTWSAWEGFYKELEERVVIDSWSYVANPSGGFLGAWWHWIPFGAGKGEMYLQFEQGDLCFKICPSGTAHSIVRGECYKVLKEKAAGRFPEVDKPPRFGAGKYMTIAKVKAADLFGQDAITQNAINVDAVIEKLRQYESLVDECCAAISI